jgi:hypothetical protein
VPRASSIGLLNFFALRFRRYGTIPGRSQTAKSSGCTHLFRVPSLRRADALAPLDSCAFTENLDITELVTALRALHRQRVGQQLRSIQEYNNQRLRGSTVALIGP